MREDKDPHFRVHFIFLSMTGAVLYQWFWNYDPQSAGSRIGESMGFGLAGAAAGMVAFWGARRTGSSRSVAWGWFAALTVMILAYVGISTS